MYPLPTFTLAPNRTPESTITAPPPRNPLLKLPPGLEIEEYPITEKDVYAIESLAYSRYPNKGGWHYGPKGGMIDGKLFLAGERIKDHRYAEIHATLDKNEIFSVDCGNITP